MYSVLDIITDTPVWVWAILVYIIVAGLIATKPRAVSWQRLAIMPVIFLVWSMYSLSIDSGLFWQALGVWIILFAAGSMLGTISLSKDTVTVNLNKLIELRGSWYPLILSLSFFVLKYGINAAYAMAPSLRTNALLWATNASISGLVSGISWGRLLYVMKIYRKAIKNE